MASGKIFKSSSYCSKILTNLYDLWKSEIFFGDGVEITCDGKVFKAHRSVLASSSTYFRAMFSVGMAEKEMDAIELRNMSSSTFSSLLNFIYTGEIYLSATTVQEVLSAADMIGLPEVVESTSDYLKNELHPTNAIGIYRFAESHTCDALSKTALSYIHRHFPEVCEQEEFLETPRNLALEFLESEELKIDSEYQVLCAAVKWLMYDLYDRKHHVFEILSKVRLPLIPSTLLHGFTEKIMDSSIQVALRCLQKDLSGKRGYLVTAQPRRNAKKHIYVIGGSRKALGSGWKQLSETTLDNVVCLDTFQKTWTNMAPMTIERILPGVAALEGLIYVVGGEQESKILANGEVYNPQENAWQSIEPMITPRCAFGEFSILILSATATVHGLTAFENSLYSFGGWVGEDLSSSIERYDPHSNEWTMIGNMEEPKFSMGICTHEGLIYIVGGCTHQTRHLQELLSYNPVTREWEMLSPMLIPRSQMGIAVLEGNMYAIGGSSKHAEVLKSVEKYIFEEDRWVEVTSMNVGRANPAVGAVDGKIYCIGGDQTVEQNFFRAQVTLASVEVYCPITDTWEECENLPESRSEAGYVVI